MSQGSSADKTHMFIQLYSFSINPWIGFKIKLESILIFFVELHHSLKSMTPSPVISLLASLFSIDSNAPILINLSFDIYNYQ